MLSRITRLSLPISGISRSPCNKNVYKLHGNSKSKLKLVQCDERNIRTYGPLLFSTQIPKEKRADTDIEENSNSFKNQKDNSKEEKTEQKSEKHYSKSNENENSQSTSDKSKKKEQDGENRKNNTIFVKDLVLHSFANFQRKEKDTFLECLRMYKSQPGRKRERVPFIYAALKFMKEFGVHRDLSVYKQIIDIFPKESMIPTNQFQTMFVHYPREQYCCTAILEQMEDNGVIPDPELELQLLNIFGQYGMPLEKYWKMMYWMPKFKNLNPWPVPHPIPNDALELAKLAITKISSVDVQSTIRIYDTNEIEESVEKTWIVSATAPKQNELLLQHNKKTAIFVEGPFRIYVATKCVDYFQLRADADENRVFPDYDPDAVDKIRIPYLDTKTVDVIVPPCLHEQMDGTYFAVCATGTSMKDSLLSWIRFLEKDNPVLAEIPIVFTLRNYTQENFYLGDNEKKQEKQLSESELNKDSKEKLLDD